MHPFGFCVLVDVLCYENVTEFKSSAKGLGMLSKHRSGGRACAAPHWEQDDAGLQHSSLAAQQHAGSGIAEAFATMFGNRD